MTTPQQLIAEVRDKVYIAAPEDCWGGFIEACANLQPETKAMLREAPTDLALLTDALEVALEALAKSQKAIASGYSPQQDAGQQVYNEARSSIIEAQTKITELIAKRGK